VLVGNRRASRLGGAHGTPRRSSSSVFGWVRRCLFYLDVGLKQGPISFIYRPCRPRASSDKIDLFVAKDVAIDFAARDDARERAKASRLCSRREIAQLKGI
jgi:hypothetical protein